MTDALETVPSRALQWPPAGLEALIGELDVVDAEQVFAALDRRD